MPTYEEWKELYNNTTMTGTTQNGVEGALFTANGNSLFLPYNFLGFQGYYWSSSLIRNDPRWASLLLFDLACEMYVSDRFVGCPVRPVREN